MAKAPSKLEVKVEEVQHRIRQATDRIQEKVARPTEQERMRRAIKKHSQAAIRRLEEEDSNDGTNGTG